MKIINFKRLPLLKGKMFLSTNSSSYLNEINILENNPLQKPKCISYTYAYTRFLKYKRKNVRYWKMHIKWKPRQARNTFKTMNRFLTKSSARVNMCFRITVMGSSFFLSSNPPETYQKIFRDSVLQQIQASSLNSQM